MNQVVDTEDLTSEAVCADPYSYYGHLRETAPVIWNDFHKRWVITRHEDVVWLLRHPEIFSSRVPAFDAPPEIVPPIDESDWALADYVNETDCPFLMHDRPEHLAMRQAIHRWFTPRAVEKWRTKVREVAQRSIEERSSQSAMEVKADLAVWLPLRTISWMMDVPEADAARLHELTNAVLNHGQDRDWMKSVYAAWRELQDYFYPLIDARRTGDGDDLLSLFGRAESEGIYDRDQCLSSAILVMFAGHETTSNLICNGIHSFIKFPEQWNRLQSDPEKWSGSATEECLRYEPSIKVLQRICLEDVEIHGATLREGDTVFWVLSSANRDPRVFDDPDAFDITRSPNRHIALGGGIHHCLGAALARLEGEEVFRALAEMVSGDLHLSGDAVEYVQNLAIREPVSLDIRWN